jgi:hypothetical protein
MVLKEETADVVSFGESAHGEQMPRVRARERAEAKRQGTCSAGGRAGGASALGAGGRGESGQANATS